MKLGFRLSLDPALGLGLDQDSEFSLRPGPSQLWAGLSVRLCTRQLISVQREQAVISFEKAAPLPPPPVQQEVGWTQPDPDGGLGPQHAGLLPCPTRVEWGSPKDSSLHFNYSTLFCNFNYIISDTEKPSLNFKPL